MPGTKRTRDERDAHEAAEEKRQNKNAKESRARDNVDNLFCDVCEMAFNSPVPPVIGGRRQRREEVIQNCTALNTKNNEEIRMLVQLLGKVAEAKSMGIDVSKVILGSSPPLPSKLPRLSVLPITAILHPLTIHR